MDSNGSARSLGDLKVGDAIAVDGAFSLSVPGSFAALGILRIEGALQPTIQTSLLHVSVADPILYIHADGNNTYAHGWPINTDASTAYFGLTRTQFFNDMGWGYFPGADIHCLPILTASVRINADGSLTALSIRETFKLDWCD
jgi:hypothetical protein